MEQVSVDFPLSPEQIEHRKRLVNELKKNPRVIEFIRSQNLNESVIEERAQMFSDWLSHQKPCVNCLGLSVCTQSKTGFALGIETQPLWTWELQACRYQKAHDALTAHRAYYVYNDAADHFLEASLDHLLDQNPEPSYMASIKPMVDWFNKPTQKGFYFYGLPGTGKTHLACAMANYFAKQAKKVAVVHVPSLALRFPTSYSDETKEIVLQQLKKAYFVVFDDIGAETYTSYFRDEILFPLLNSRMEDKKLTVFTSNHSLDALKNHFRYNQKADDESVKSMRLMERIQALSQALQVGGSNRRDR